MGCRVGCSVSLSTYRLSVCVPECVRAYAHTTHTGSCKAPRNIKRGVRANEEQTSICVFQNCTAVVSLNFLAPELGICLVQDYSWLLCENTGLAKGQINEAFKLDSGKPPPFSTFPTPEWWGEGRERGGNVKKKKKMEYKALALKKCLFGAKCLPVRFPGADRSICSAQSSQSPQTVQEMSRALTEEAMRHTFCWGRWVVYAWHTPFPFFCLSWLNPPQMALLS